MSHKRNTGKRKQAALQAIVHEDSVTSLTENGNNWNGPPLGYAASVAYKTVNSFLLHGGFKDI
ncbi:MAG: hypothetical protein ACO1QB_10500 [Verrucomicrobiales bacterium]